MMAEVGGWKYLPIHLQKIPVYYLDLVKIKILKINDFTLHSQ